MTKIKRTKIRIEMHEVKVIAFRKTAEKTFSEVCRDQVAAISAEQVAEVLNIPLSALVQTDALVENAQPAAADLRDANEHRGEK